MGVVFRAEHTLLGMTVAIKVLQSTNETWVERFKREAQVLAKVDHPNVCNVTDFGPLADDGFFLVMEHLEGEELFDLLDREHRLSPQRTIDLFTQLLGALGACHAQGVVHRDLKPENVMILRGADGSEQVKLLDFGIAGYQGEAAKRNSRLTELGTAMGTPHYMSPEQATAKATIDGRSDLYQVGVMLYEALSGELPFNNDELAKVLWMQVHVPPPRLSEHMPRLRAVAAFEQLCIKLLTKDREARFQTAEEVIAALEAISEQLADAADDEPTAEPVDPPDSDRSHVSHDTHATSSLPAQVAMQLGAEDARLAIGSMLERGPTGTAQVSLAPPLRPKESRPPIPRAVWYGAGALLALALIMLTFGGGDDDGPTTPDSSDGAAATSPGSPTKAPGALGAPEGVAPSAQPPAIGNPAGPAAAPSPHALPGAATSGFSVTSHVVARKVSGKNPRHVGARFPASVKKLYCHVVFDNRSGRRKVQMLWYHGDHEVSRATLRVRTSRSYRTWASVRIGSHQLGTWRCDIRDQDSRLLSRTEFAIDPQ